MIGLISAIRFLTLLPIGKANTYDPQRMVPFFPLVGIIVGVLLAAFDWCMLRLWPQNIASLLDVVFLVVVTGAFHLDGLGDTADGLLGHRSRAQALAIMKDSRIGAMGLIAVVCGLLMKWGGITGLDGHRHLLLIVIPAYARAGQVLGIHFLEYGRPDGGTGHALFGNSLKPADFWGLLIPVVLSFWLGWPGILLILVFVALTAGILWYFQRRMGCMTGDMLGAMTEVTESMLFLLVTAGASV
ncbi:MAG: adenosylcobinamide-GDP ribazoletransferase [Desulfomonilaceae bacterium]|nr:adenosylcobinamide-GDP ribazoletransferase [Desulfomonilaceae bacterium]